MDRASLYALQGFVAAARLRNLSRAAAELHLTVSALSHQLRGLEERLGRRLFERGPRGVSFTPDGERLYDRIAPHLDAIEQALRPYAARRDEVLTLSLMPSFASSWLVPRLPRFVAAHPQIEINLQSSTNLVDFAREPVDAALRFGPGSWPGVAAEHLFDDWITPTASPALIEREGRPTLDQLGRFPLLGDPGNRWAEWFQRFGGHEPARFVAHFNDSETLHRAERDQLSHALRQTAQQRADQEHHHRGLEDQPPAVDVAELAEQRRGDGGGDDVRGADPGEALEGVELAGDGGQRGGDDRRVQGREEDGDDQRAQHGNELSLAEPRNGRCT